MKIIIKFIDTIDWSGIKAVLLRLDLNLDQESGKITDTYRLDKAMPTIQILLDKNVKVVVASHWGRPNGQVVAELKMNKIAKLLADRLGQEVLKLDDCIGQSKKINKTKARVIVLENLRFYEEEENNDENFARELAKQADFFINDAFSASHREHASLVAVTKYLDFAGGPLLQSEIENLEKAKNPKKPAILILGGAKLATKIPVIDNLLPNYDYILIGGAVANTLLKARGVDIRKSKTEECPEEVKMVLDSNKLVLPEDYVWKDDQILDIGANTIENFKKILDRAKTVVWNGPLGLYEKKPFDKASKEIGEYLLKLSAETIIGGGDTIDSLHDLPIFDRINHVSTAGGAMLEYLAGKILPGLKALERE